jgi:hypothetical protein
VAGSFGNTCRWKALRVWKAVLVGASADGRALAPSQVSVSESGGDRTRSVRGQTEQPCTRLKTLRRGGIARCGARPFPLGRGVVGFAEVGNAPSSAYPPGVLFPQGSRTPRGRFEHVSMRPAVSSAKAVRSGIERSVGARVVDRLQRLARYIFPDSFGWAARLAKASQGSSSRQSPSRRRWVWPRRTKGCRNQSCVNVKVNANWLHSAARLSIAPAEGVLGRMSLLP